MSVSYTSYVTCKLQLMTGRSVKDYRLNKINRKSSLKYKLELGQRRRRDQHYFTLISDVFSFCIALRFWVFLIFSKWLTRDRSRVF